MTDLAEQLEAALDEGYPELEELHGEELVMDGLPVERWRITDEGRADWALRKLSKLGDEQDKIGLLVATQREQLETFEANALHRIQQDRARLEALLLEYHRNELDADPKRRTIRLPHGRITATKAQDSWEIDEAAFIPWAQENAPDLLAVTIKPKLAEAKKAFDHVDLAKHQPGQTTTAVTHDGEEVPGIVIERRPDWWKAEPGSWT